MIAYKIQAGTTERHNRVVSIIYSNICSVFVLHFSKTKREIPQKAIENNEIMRKIKILWDFIIQINKQVLYSQPDIIVADRNQK